MFMFFDGGETVFFEGTQPYLINITCADPEIFSQREGGDGNLSLPGGSEACFDNFIM